MSRPKKKEGCKRAKQKEGYEIKGYFRNNTLNFRPYDDFYTENIHHLTSNDVYMRPIKLNEKTIGVLTHADEEYLYGIIDMSAIMVKLTIDIDLSVEKDLQDKYEEINKQMNINPDDKKETSDKGVFATQKKIPMMDKYTKYYNYISQKVNCDHNEN